MPLSILPSFLFYCLVAGITPGPANLTSLSTAIRKGRRAALTQWRGLFTGFFTVSMLAVLLTYFVGSQLTEYVHWFSFVGALYILWLAWHIWTDKGEASEAGEKKSALREGTFLFGFCVQMTNVKIMIFCVTALAGFVLPYSTGFVPLLIVGLLLPFTGAICNLVWLFAGTQLQKLFAAHRRLINGIMALSLVFCAWSLVFS